MLKKFINGIKNIEKPILKVMKKGFLISFGICLISLLILCFYNAYPLSYDIYYCGIELFKSSLMFAVSFFVCGYGIHSIKNGV